MKIKIKEFQGRPVTQGFFPVANVKMVPGEVYECADEDQFADCMETGIVEAVVEPKRRVGRPSKTENDID